MMTRSNVSPACIRFIMSLVPGPRRPDLVLGRILECGNEVEVGFLDRVGSENLDLGRVRHAREDQEASGDAERSRAIGLVPIAILPWCCCSCVPFQFARLEGVHIRSGDWRRCAARRARRPGPPAPAGAVRLLLASSNSCLLDDRTPFFDLRPHVRAQRFGRRADNDDSEVFEASLDGGIGERHGCVGVYFLDDGFRRLRRHEEREPAGNIETGQPRLRSMSAVPPPPGRAWQSSPPVRAHCQLSSAAPPWRPH